MSEKLEFPSLRSKMPQALCSLRSKSVGVLLALHCAGCRESPTANTESASAPADYRSPAHDVGALGAEKAEEKRAPRKPSAVVPGALPPGLFAPRACIESGVARCEELCAAGSLKDCGAAALATMNGWGTEQNLDRAKRLADQGCAEKDPMSCGVLAGFYARGISVPVDAPRAAELLFFACEQGDALSCEILAETRLARARSEDDAKLAIEYFMRACDRGHLRACMQGAASSQDKKLKIGRDVNDLYKRACDAGFARACSLLGKSLRKGSGGAVDAAGAKIAYDEACRLGELKSCE